MSRSSKAIGDISDLTLGAATRVELREGLAAILRPLVSNDCVGVMSAAAGRTFQLTIIGAPSEPFASQAWRYTLACPRDLVKRLATSFARSTELDAHTLTQLAFQREYFAPNGIDVLVARIWSLEGHFYCVGMGRQRADFSDNEVHLLDRISPHLAVAMRMSQLLAQDTEANFSAFFESYDLSPRLREVAQLLARGLRNAEIATVLHLTTNTVRNYIADLFRRADVSSRAELAFLMSTPSCREDPTARQARELLEWMRASAIARAWDSCTAPGSHIELSTERPHCARPKQSQPNGRHCDRD